METTFFINKLSPSSLGYSSDVVPKSKTFFFSSIGKAHIINALYGFGYTIQIAMLPYLLISSNAGIEHNGYLLTLFSFLQFVGALFFGRLADAWGVKKSFYLSLSSSCLMYILLIGCRDTMSYYVSFLPAFFMQTFQASSLLVCLKTDKINRTSAIGYLNLSYGIGLISGSFSAAVTVKYVGTRGNIAIAFFSQLIALYVASTLTVDPKLAGKDQVEKLKLTEFFSSMKDEVVRVLNLFKKTFGICLLIIFGLLPILMTKFAFAPVVIDMFKLTPSHTSYLMAYVGILTIIAEGVFAPFLSSLFGDITCCKYSIPLTLAGFLILSLCGPYESLVILFMTIPLCGGALLYICGTSQMTKRVDEKELGTVIGLNTSIFYAITIVAPYLALKSYIALGLGLYWLLCATICFVLTLYIFVIDKRTLQIFKEDDANIETMDTSINLL